MIVGMSEGKEQLVRPMHRWKNGIKTDLEKESGKLGIGSVSFRTETSCKQDSKFWGYIKG